MQGAPTGKTIAACALAVLVGGVLAVGVAAHTTRHDSDLNLNAFTSGGVNEYFYGSLSSPHEPCEPDRRIRIFRKRPGDDKLYVATRSLEPPNSGSYTVDDTTGNIPQGVYYSHVKSSELKRSRRHTHVCKGARSTELDVGP
jgi:hypothetical protein